MTRIVCFSPYPEEGPSVRHRIVALRGALAAEGVQVRVWSFMTARFYRMRRRFGPLRLAEKLFWFAFGTLRLLWRIPLARHYDVVIIHREAFPLGSAWAERAIARVNPRTVFDLDDAIWEPPSNAVNQRGALVDPERVSDTMRACAAVSAGNAYLAAYARERNARVEIVPTSYPDLGGVAAGRAPTDEPVVLWIGNWGNAGYLGDIAGALAEVARTHRYRLRIVGGADVHELALPGVPTERVEWTEAGERGWLTSADIGIMPLLDSPYERGKCAFKLIQYMSAGLPVIASPVGANRDVVRDGETGFLAADEAAWADALRALLGDATRRQRMGRAGHARYRAHYSPDAVRRGWGTLLQAVGA